MQARETRWEVNKVKFPVTEIQDLELNVESS